MLKHIQKRFSGDRAKKSEAVHFSFNARLKCGNVWHVEMFGMWKCLACGNVWHVEMFGMWKCLACGNVWHVEMFGRKHRAVFCNLN